MKTIEVKTGFGYFTNSKGQITDKATLPIGKHSLSDGYIYMDVNSKEDLDKIQIYTPSIVETEEQKTEKLIQAKIREIAIAELKKEGKLN